MESSTFIDMKQTLFLTLFIFYIFFARAQKADSIYFHLYTDSLKKGTHNYINVDGRSSNNKWFPLTDKEIRFTSSYGVFEGNDLVLPDHPSVDKVTIKAELKSNPLSWKETVIWIKKKPDDEVLPTKDEIQKNTPPSKTKKKNKNQGRNID
jgi:hypothetical protein